MRREEYEKLCDEVWRHNRLYFQDAKPEISDDEYDKLVKKLEAIEEEHPDWVSPTSPTQRLGEKPLHGFPDVEHTQPMLSLEKAFSLDEMQDFDGRVRKLLGGKLSAYATELKMDGLAISIVYIDGHYKQAITRGDGWVGSDVTNNVKTLKSLPLRLKMKKPIHRLEVRGEVFLPKNAFDKMNLERQKNNEPLWANPRNAAAGSLKLLDPKEVAKRTELSVVFYGAVFEPGFPVKSQYELHGFLHELGLPTLPSVIEQYEQAHKELWGKELPSVQRCASIDEVMAFAKEVDEKRKFLPFGIDGIVVKLDDLSAFEQLGATAKHPRAAIAYKFSAEQAWTKINDITVQVGRTGVLTPVAELEPVLLAGSTISRATLHNFEEMERKDIRVHDYALVEKGGDVIPKVVTVDVSKRAHGSKPFPIPTHCPSCYTKVVKDPTEVALRCPNQRGCPEQILRGLIHFVGKDGLDIENLGEKVMEQLVKKKFVKRPSDIFRLTKEELYQLDSFKEKSVQNLLASIEKSKKTTLAQLLMGLGIRYVGAQAAEIIAHKAHNIEGLEKLTKEDLLSCQGIGEKVASSFVDYLSHKEHLDEIHELKHLGVHFKETAHTIHKDHPLFNKTIVLTGTLEHLSRHDAEKRVKEVGGKVTDSVSKKTDYLVVGAEPGSKFEKAKKLGILILDEQAFLQLLGK